MIDLFDITLDSKEFPVDTYVQLTFSPDQSRPNDAFDLDLLQASRTNTLDMHIVEWSPDGTEVFLKKMHSKTSGSWWSVRLLSVKAVLDARGRMIHDHVMLCRCDSILRNRKKAA